MLVVSDQFSLCSDLFYLFYCFILLIIVSLCILDSRCDFYKNNNFSPIVSSTSTLVFSRSLHLRLHCDFATYFNLRSSRLFEPTSTSTFELWPCNFSNFQSLSVGLGDPILAPQPLSTVRLTSLQSDWVFFPSRRTVGTSVGVKQPVLGSRLNPAIEGLLLSNMGKSYGKSMWSGMEESDSKSLPSVLAAYDWADCLLDLTTPIGSPDSLSETGKRIWLGGLAESRIMGWSSDLDIMMW